MDDRLYAALEESLAYGPEHAAGLIEWLHGFSQRQACRETRKQSGLADGWKDIEHALDSAMRALAGDK